jgi:ABC-2 type transport system permease protein
VRLDATDPLVARALRAAVGGLEEQLERAAEGGGTRAARAPRPDLIRPRHVTLRVLADFNPELRTAVFVVPALLGVILTSTMILMTAVAIVRERERGTFEFLMATPVRQLELMLGKILPYIAIGLTQIALILTAGLLLFRVPVRGGLLDLGVASLLFIAANLALGLVISAVTSTQLQATQLSFFFFLPSVLLSGFMFPFEAMPGPARWAGELLPLTHYVRLVRGILLRGAPLAAQLDDLLAIAALAAAGVVAASLLLRKELL